MTEIVRIIYQEMNERLQGGKKIDDNSKKGHAGNGDPPFPSSSSSSTSSSSTSMNQSHKSKATGKSPFLKLDSKFELPMFNREVNAEKLDNWIRQLEV